MKTLLLLLFGTLAMFTCCQTDPLVKSDISHSLIFTVDHRGQSISSESYDTDLIGIKYDTINELISFYDGIDNPIIIPIMYGSVDLTPISKIGDVFTHDGVYSIINNKDEPTLIKLSHVVDQNNKQIIIYLELP